MRELRRQCIGHYHAETANYIIKSIHLLTVSRTCWTWDGEIYRKTSFITRRPWFRHLHWTLYQDVPEHTFSVSFDTFIHVVAFALFVCYHFNSIYVYFMVNRKEHDHCNQKIKRYMQKYIKKWGIIYIYYVRTSMAFQCIEKRAGYVVKDF